MDQFYFEGFEPTPAILDKTNRLYSRLLEDAPSDALISALLEWDGQLYHCSIEIAAHGYAISVGTNHRNAAIAVDKAELALARKRAKRGPGPAPRAAASSTPSAMM